MRRSRRSSTSDAPLLALPFLVSLLLVLLSGGGAAAEVVKSDGGEATASPGVDELLLLHASYRSPVLLETEAVTVDAELAVDTFLVDLEGTLVPLASVDVPGGSGVQGWWFEGRGRHVLTPVTRSEWWSLSFRSQIDGFERLETDFTRALLWLDEETSSALAEQVSGPAVTGTVADGTGELLRHLHGSPFADLALRLLAASANSAGVEKGRGLAYLLTDSVRPGPTLVAHDLRGVLDGEETALYVFGDASSVVDGNEAADAVDDGYWYSSPRREAVSAGRRYGSGATPLLDVAGVELTSTISRDVDLEGAAVVDAGVLVPSLSVLSFELAPSLRISAVSVTHEGADVRAGIVQSPEVEENPTAAVLLERPVTFGDRVELRLSYAGDEVLLADGVRTYRVGARTSWYPNFDDPAVFDLTFEVPKGSMVVAVGEPVSETEGDGTVVSRWRTGTPVRVAGFNYGAFKEYRVREENTGYDLAVYASLGVPDIITEINGMLRQQSGVMSPDQAVAVANSGVTLISQYSGATDLGVSLEGLAQSALADAQNSVQVFTARFGPSPFDRLAITQQAEWTFGQAWPGLIYLPYAAAFSTRARAMLGLSGMAEFIDEVGIHEIAHQWWGHLIGWKTYRDQWISEGFAEFSAALVLEATGGQEAYDAFWRSRRRNVLGGRFGAAPPAWAGPLTLGFRASSSRSPYAYQGLAYAKGGFVLHMLRELMRNPAADQPDAAFFAMLRDFARTHAGGEASTADFQAMVQKHFVPQLDATGDGTVDWFFEQWVHGRAIPTIAHDLQWESAGRGRYRIHGTVSQRNVPDDFISVLSFDADLGKGGVGTFGRAGFRGSMSREIDTVVELPRRPRELMVNHRNGVLAYDPPDG